MTAGLGVTCVTAVMGVVQVSSGVERNQMSNHTSKGDKRLSDEPVHLQQTEESLPPKVCEGLMSALKSRAEVSR